MSYRYRIGKVSKDYYERIKDLSYDELVNFCKLNNPDSIDECDESIYIHGFEVLKQEELFDFGDCDLEGTVQELSVPAFSKECTQKHFEDNFLRLCNQETFLAIIDEMRKMIVDYMQRLRDNRELTYLHFDDKLKEWKRFDEVINCSSLSEEKRRELNEFHYPYDIRTDSEQLIRSWRYEYSIFELVRLYKSFDWDNYHLVFYGW